MARVDLIGRDKIRRSPSDVSAPPKKTKPLDRNNPPIDRIGNEWPPRRDVNVRGAGDLGSF